VPGERDRMETAELRRMTILQLGTGGGKSLVPRAKKRENGQKSSSGAVGHSEKRDWFVHRRETESSHRFTSSCDCRSFGRRMVAKWKRADLC
jgi:hypothetical protein